MKSFPKYLLQVSLKTPLPESIDLGLFLLHLQHAKKTNEVLPLKSEFETKGMSPNLQERVSMVK
ncbi:MAG: hypothetical protein GY915_04085 [bacterium]|nr:hypothetical protein [bacterium]